MNKQYVKKYKFIHQARVAQSVERMAFNHDVRGSSPLAGETRNIYFSKINYIYQNMN